MTAILSAIKPTRRPGELGVHSVDRFHFAVPDLAIAKNFYGEFNSKSMRTAVSWP